MKKQTILFVTISILLVLLTACASSGPLSPQPTEDAAVPSPSQAPEQDAPPAVVEQAEETSAPVESESPASETGGAPPGELFDTAEEAAEHIKAVKAAGVEETVSSNHVGLYDKEHFYVLKEPPLPGSEQSFVILTLQGIGVRYETGDNREIAMFSWVQGYGDDEKIENHIADDGLERYKDTKFYYGRWINDIYIYWWEHGDQFSFMYPADTNIPLEDVIERIEVVKYDV